MKKKTIIEQMIPLIEQITENQRSIHNKLFADLIFGGCCIYKTEVVDGKPSIKYVDPISREAEIAMYNATHDDSKLTTAPAQDSQTSHQPNTNTEQSEH